MYVISQIYSFWITSEFEFSKRRLCIMLALWQILYHHYQITQINKTTFTLNDYVTQELYHLIVTYMTNKFSWTGNLLKVLELTNNHEVKLKALLKEFLALLLEDGVKANITFERGLQCPPSCSGCVKEIYQEIFKLLQVYHARWNWDCLGEFYREVFISVRITE